jgi:cell fate regulator YaaT (PSP1 superfamily)
MFVDAYFQVATHLFEHYELQSPLHLFLKEYFKNNSAITVSKGQWVTVEGVGGFDMGQISLTGELVKLQMKKYGVQDQTALKRVMRVSTTEDLEAYNESKLREKEIMVRSRAIAKELKVDMKIGEVELQADVKKATFFYTAEHRVDFRELIKVFATDFKNKITQCLQNLIANRQTNFWGQILQHHSLQSTKYMSKWIEAKNK